MHPEQHRRFGVQGEMLPGVDACRAVILSLQPRPTGRETVREVANHSVAELQGGQQLIAGDPVDTRLAPGASSPKLMVYTLEGIGTNG